MSKQKVSPGRKAWLAAQAKQVETAAVQKVGQEVKSASASTVAATTCRICGKPLTRLSSIAQGQGDICASKIKLLPAGVTLASHYEALQEVDVPEGFILLRDAIAQAREKDCSGYRFIQACGGDRMLRLPFNPNFKVVFVRGKRYVSRLALQDLELLKKI